MYNVDDYVSGHENEEEYDDYYWGNYDEESIKLWEHEKQYFLPLQKDDVVQFGENHKWCGCLGIVEEVKSEDRYMVGVPMPEQGTAYIFCQRSDIHLIGQAVLISQSDNDSNELSDYSEDDCDE